MTTRPPSIARWSWRKEAWRSTTVSRSPTCSSAGSTCGARSTIRRLRQQSVAWRSTRMMPRVMSAWVIRWTMAGRPAEGLPLIEKAMRLDPHYPPMYLFWLGHAFHSLERYDEAAAAYRRVISRSPDFYYAHLYLAAVYAQQGRMEEAKAEAAEALRIDTGRWAQRRARHLPLKDPAALARLLDGMRKAGLLE